MIKIKYKLTIIYTLLILLSILINISPLIDKKQQEETVSTSTYNEKIAYLTFDDGPSENTIKILNILDKYEIKATFFVVGPSYKLKNDLLNEIIKRGHKIGIHSYTHTYSEIYKNKDSYIKDFYLCLNWIKNKTGISPSLYRFPGGSSNTITSKKQILNIINELYDDGYSHVDWNIDSFDSHYNNDYNAIIKNTINCLKVNENNNIYRQTILMHDTKKKVATIEALPSIIEYFLSHNYKFSLLDDNHLSQHIKRSTNVGLYFYNYFLIPRLFIKSRYCCGFFDLI